VSDTISPGDRALGELIDAAHLAQADSIPALLSAAAGRFGASDVQLLIVDHAQEALVPFPPMGPFHEVAQSLQDTIPGRAFRLVQTQDVSLGGSGARIWTPVLDGVDRLGVLGATLAEPTPLARRRLLRLAGMTAYLLVVKADVGDVLARTARRRPMSLAAELQWTTLPPLSVATERVAMSAMLEPCYDVGGDAVDHAIHDDVAHFAIFDAQGHGLRASVMANLAVAAYRNARRAQQPLREIAGAIDAAIADQFGDGAFVTTILSTLDLRTGELTSINAGHPPAMLLRGHQVVKTLDGPANRPLGVGLNSRLRLHAEQLQPGDQVLAYTDGAIEARNGGGEPFGVDRLAELVTRADAAGEPLAETMRRVSRAVLAYNAGDMRDDASHMLVGWRTEHPLATLPAELAGSRASDAPGTRTSYA
jgi:serine phosphatase RsbU (regulator of sigma subunit)